MVLLCTIQLVEYMLFNSTSSSRQSLISLSLPDLTSYRQYLAEHVMVPVEQTFPVGLATTVLNLDD